MEKIKIITVVGPTASGKTALAASLAKNIGGEVISADSMQIYRGMDIATAKPSKEEMLGVPHHLIGFLDPSQVYSVARFCEDAAICADEITARGNIPVICGGTGLYVDSLVSGMTFLPEEETGKIREEIIKKRGEGRLGEMLSELKKADPEFCDGLDFNNEKRVIRALEIWYSTGVIPSVARKKAKENESRFDEFRIYLAYRDRGILYGRIDRRVDEMLEKGLEDETRAFYSSNAGSTAVQAIGYKELLPYLNGEITLTEAADNLKRATRRYAKRQITWFRKNENNHTVFCDDYSSSSDILGYALGLLADFPGVK